MPFSPFPLAAIASNSVRTASQVASQTALIGALSRQSPKRRDNLFTSDPVDASIGPDIEWIWVEKKIEHPDDPSQFVMTRLATGFRIIDPDA